MVDFIYIHAILFTNNNKIKVGLLITIDSLEQAEDCTKNGWNVLVGALVLLHYTTTTLIHFRSRFLHAIHLLRCFYYFHYLSDSFNSFTIFSL